MASAPEVLIGLDLGTSAVKAVTLDAEGNLLAQSGAPYPTRAPQPGWAEQDPADWQAAAHTALGALVAALPAATRPLAMALSAQMPTLALLGQAGRALRPAIVWYDGRAETEATRFLTEIDAAQWYRRTGIVLDAHYLVPMYAWIAAHEPEVIADQVPHLGSAKDALLRALCGTWLTDPATASGSAIFDPRAGAWDGELCRIAGIDPVRLPAVVAPTTLAGGLTSAWGETGLPANLPVYVGAADALTGVLGSGAAEPGTLAMITGTSTSLVLTTGDPVLDPGRRALLTPHALPDRWGSEMDLMATGAAVGWLEGILERPRGTLDSLAAGSEPGARGLLAFPYLAGGEQGALWDPHVPAAFLGLRLDHGVADLAMALLEGIAYESRRCLAAWDQMGLSIHEVVLSGGMVRPLFAQMLAAVLGRPVRVAGTGPSSAVGAALLAGIGQGVWSMEEAAQIARRGLGEPLIASSERIARYGDLYRGYERASGVLRERIGPIPGR